MFEHFVHQLGATVSEVVAHNWVLAHWFADSSLVTDLHQWQQQLAFVVGSTDSIVVIACIAPGHSSAAVTDQHLADTTQEAAAHLHHCSRTHEPFGKVSTTQQSSPLQSSHLGCCP